MAPHGAGNLSTLTPEELQAKCEELCFMRPPARAFNVLVEGVEILYEAGTNGNMEAFKWMEHLAKEATAAAKDFERAKTAEIDCSDVNIAAETLFQAAVNGNMEAYKRLVQLAEEAIQAAGDKNL